MIKKAIFTLIFSASAVAGVPVNECSYPHKSSSGEIVRSCIMANLENINMIYRYSRNDNFRIGQLFSYDITANKNGNVTSVKSVRKYPPEYEKFNSLIINYLNHIVMPNNNDIYYKQIVFQIGVEGIELMDDSYANEKPADLEGALPVESVREAIDMYGSKFAEIYHEALKNNPSSDFEGTILLRFTINPHGDIQEIYTFKKDPQIPAEFESKIINIFKDIKFQESKLGFEGTFPVNLYRH